MSLIYILTSNQREIAKNLSNKGNYSIGVMIQ